VSDHVQVRLEGDERIDFAPYAGPWRVGGLAACVIGLVAALLVGLVSSEGIQRFFFAYLVNFAFFLSLALGALFFVLIQHATKAGWSVGVRRVAESVASAMPWLVVAFVPILMAILLGRGDLYRWARVLPSERLADTAGDVGHTGDSHGVQHNEAGAGGANIDTHSEDLFIAKKRPYLGAQFFIGRWTVYFAVWCGLAVWMRRQSVAQDEGDDSTLTVRMQAVAPVGLVLFALTVTFAAFDLLMSLSPAWYSTIFGVYYFTGSFVGALALLILMLMGVQRAGLLVRSITTEHYHDLGKFLFAFVFFWGYIAFSQYMLIWYASLPETTFWYAARGATGVAKDMNAWTYVSILLLLGHFIIPFVGLMSRQAKRRKRTLAFWAVWLLMFHWIDLWWMVMPEMGPTLRLGLPELATFAAVGGLFVFAVARNAAAASLIPLHDPRLGESLGFENI